MRKSAVLVLVGLLSVALASAAMAQQYDRDEKNGGPAPGGGGWGGWGRARWSDEAPVPPLPSAPRLILPAPVFEPYVGLGLGIYFADLEEPGIDDSDTTFGGDGALGLDAWLHPRMALNLEGEYHWVEPGVN